MTRTHWFLLLVVALALITVAQIILSPDWAMMAAAGLMLCVLAVLLLLGFAALTAPFFLLAWLLMQWMPSPIVGRRPLPLTLALMALTGLWLGMAAMLTPKIWSSPPHVVQIFDPCGITPCMPPEVDWDLKTPLVLATPGLREVLTEAADVWATQSHGRPMLWFVAGSTLAQRAVTGHADLFLSADAAWMDDLQRQGQLRPGTRSVFAGDRLVLVVRHDDPLQGNLATLLAAGPLAIANPADNPDKAALARLGLWADMARRGIAAENAQAALTLVERGAARLALVHASDAGTTTRVRVATRLPDMLSARYSLARLKTSDNDDAEGFRRFLLSAAGQAILARHGFTPP